MFIYSILEMSGSGFDCHPSPTRQNFANPMSCPQTIIPRHPCPSPHPRPSPHERLHTRDMARTKRSRLPSVRSWDVKATPEQVRRTPNGGWAWKCAYCGRYASDRSVAGKFICRCHGGSTPRQRDPLLSYVHTQQTGRKLQTPGRPLIHGRYARLPSIPIAEILTDYRLSRRKQVKAERQWIWGEIATMQAQLDAFRPSDGTTEPQR